MSHHLGSQQKIYKTVDFFATRNSRLPMFAFGGHWTLSFKPDQFALLRTQCRIIRARKFGRLYVVELSWQTDKATG
jgi:hypothetical protein